MQPRPCTHSNLRACHNGCKQHLAWYATPSQVYRFKIYTKTGDKGTSSLYNGQRKAKTDAVFTALGDVDEVNAHLGVVAAHCQEAAPPTDAHALVATQLAEIQARLLDVGSAIATPLDESSARKVAVVTFDANAATSLEEWIDDMDDQLPPLKSFILPSGGVAAAQLHVARSVCRRAERAVVALGDDAVPQDVRQFMNRLSDYLFTAARFVAFATGAPETTYQKAR